LNIPEKSGGSGKKNGETKRSIFKIDIPKNLKLKMKEKIANRLSWCRIEFTAIEN